ncbi:MAG: radical SAM protein, partial [Candidatus Omnitrophica bacterium]|nr:radical SAM protein [Candidatus Omnitrophota bacterium]
IKPGGRGRLFGNLTQLSGFAPPLDIGLLAGFLREQGFSVRIIDADAEFLTPRETAQKAVEYDPLLAGIFAHTMRMGHASQTVKEIRSLSPRIAVLLGGRHPSALPAKTLTEEQPDFVVEGEAYLALARLLPLLRSRGREKDYDIKNLWYRGPGGEVRSNPRAPLVNLDELPLIAWDLLPMDKYRAHNWQCFGSSFRQPYAILYTSIGCPFDCNYCCVNTVYGKPGIRFRSPEKVLEELDYLVANYKVRYIRITDDNFTFNPERVNRICDLIIARGYSLNMWCYSRVDTVTEGMLKKMKQAGIEWICYGIEAGRQGVREGVSKKINSSTIERAVAMTRQAGIHIIANFIFGLPDDTRATMQETLDMAKRFNFEYVNLYAAMAWPGSQLYEQSVRAGIPLPGTWDGYSPLSEDTLPLPTKYLAPSEVLKFRDRAFEEYFGNPAYQAMIVEKFGAEAAQSVQEMLKNKIKRRYADQAAPGVSNEKK